MIKLTKDKTKEIVDLLKQEKIVALPTDTIYGFSCLATSNTALENLCKLKQCSDEKMFIILVSQSFDLSKIAIMTDNVKRFVRDNTPNPITMILQRQPDTHLAKNFNIPTIAIRIPKDEFLQKILSEVGFMVSTSCNIHGQPNLTSSRDIVDSFPTLDGIVETEEKHCSLSSTIVDLTSSELKVLRQGGYIIK